MRDSTKLGLAALAVLIALPLAACGDAAASPLEVTYYYLPG